jgi:hypothetical protein
MRRFACFIMVLAIAVAASASQASAQAGKGLGHYFYWMFDDDGDGIPNGQDADWVRPLDGFGHQIKNGFSRALPGMVAAQDGNEINARYKQQYRKNPNGSLGDMLRIRLHLHTRDCE